MGGTESRRHAREPGGAPSPEDIDPGAVEDVRAWELIDAEVGRYLPRRIRGSFRGRALG